MPSSVIRDHHYRAEESELDILFTTGRRYIYHRVPPEVADKLSSAFSKGRYFNAHIRDHYDYSEVSSSSR